MKCAYLIPLLLMMPSLRATEAEMNKALAQWGQQMEEYQAALEVAATPEQRAGVLPPQEAAVAVKLWKAVSAKTGTRTVTLPDKTKRQVSTYEFEQPWAAPAVAWFMCHPDAFAKLFASKPRQQSYFAEALWNSVDRVHYSSPAMAQVCVALINSASRKSHDLLVKIFTQNTDPTTKASAALALTIILDNPLVASADGNAGNTRARRAYYLKQAAQYAPEDAMFGNVTLEAAITEAAYILRHLSVGAVPPQMQLKDIKGQDVTLPQPGKSHLLYFWAPGTEDSYNAVFHMESVQESYPDLAICPITAAPENAAEWAETLEHYGISACYTDDAQGTAAAAYRISQVPTAVLLDPTCHIVYIGAPGLELQSAILRLSAKKDTPAAPARQPEGKPVIQPRHKPTQPNQSAEEETAPPLREMPEF